MSPVVAGPDGLVSIRCSSSAGTECWSACIQRVLQDPAFGPHARVLVDRRELPTIDSPQDIDRVLLLLELDRERLVGTKWAIVAGSTTVAYGSARMLAMRATIKGIAMEAFGSVEDALQWLDVSVE